MQAHSELLGIRTTAQMKQVESDPSLTPLHLHITWENKAENEQLLKSQNTNMYKSWI